VRSIFSLKSSKSKTSTTGVVQGEGRMSRREWTVVLLLVTSAIINYVDRSNLSIAAPALQRQFDLSPIQIGTLLSAFFWTYALLQLTGIAGWFSDRLPVGWVMFGGYVVWSGATLVTGMTSGITTLLLARLLLGAGESVAYPCYSRIFAELPQQQRGRANAFIDAGTKLGPAAGAFLGGLLLVHFGWRMLFVALGAGGMLWVLPWLRVMPRSAQKVGEGSSAPLPPIFRLLRLKCAWGTFLGHFCGNYFLYFLLTWLPTYLVREEKMQVGPMSRLASAVFLLIASSTLVTGWISDHLIAAGSSPTRVRLGVVVGGLAVASSLLCFKSLGDQPDACRACDGGALDKLAERGGQSRRYCRPVVGRGDCTGQREFAMGICRYGFDRGCRGHPVGVAR
jgi:ACS family D-galactonate transporter-like MFS transporter